MQYSKFLLSLILLMLVDLKSAEIEDKFSKSIILGFRSWYSSYQIKIAFSFGKTLLDIKKCLYKSMLGRDEENPQIKFYKQGFFYFVELKTTKDIEDFILEKNEDSYLYFEIIR